MPNGHPPAGPPPGPPPAPPVPPVAPPIPPVPPPAPGPAHAPAAPLGRRWGRILGISAGVLAALWCVAKIQHCRGYDEGIEKNMDDVRGELFKHLVEKEDIEVPSPKIRLQGTVYRHENNLVPFPQEQMVVMDRCGKAHPATILILKTRNAGNGFLEGSAVVQVATYHVIEGKVSRRSYTYALDDLLLGDAQVREWNSEATLIEE